MNPPLIETRGLSKHFGGVQAVRTIDFALAEMELRCLIGPNGAGKSTFFKMLTGQLQPTTGTIRFRGRDTTGIKTQVPNVFNGLSVHENVFIAASRAHTLRRAHAIVDEVLTRTSLTDIAY